MDKLILEVRKFTPGDSNVVRLTDEAMALIRELQAQSGLSARHIVCKMIEYAAERVEIVEVNS